MLRSLRFLIATLVVHTLVLSSVAWAHSDVISDAQGDVPATAPPYVDILQTKVTEQVGNGTLFFHMELAGAAPRTPSAFLAWNWVIDLPGGPIGEYFIVVRWCTQAMVADCGPGPAHWESALISGAGATLNAFPFVVNGATVKAYVDPGLIGDPTTFNWWAISRLFPGPSGRPPSDRAPGSGTSTFAR